MAKLKTEEVEGETIHILEVRAGEYYLAESIADKFNLFHDVSNAKKIAGTIEKAAEYVSGMSGSMFLDLKPAEVKPASKTKHFVTTPQCAAALENLSNAFNMNMGDTIAATLEMYRVMSPSKSGGKLSQSGAFLIVE